MRFGNLISGVSVSDTKFVGMSTLNQLEAYGLKRPSTVEDATKKDMKGDRPLQMAHDLRDEVQRRFDAKRIKNALAYARYIEQVEIGGRPGGTPPITLWCQRAELGDGGLVIPYGHPLVAIDGETQSEARWILRDNEDFLKLESGDNPLAVVVFFGVDEVHARQILHDFNRYANPVSEKQLAAQNVYGPVTSAVEAILGAAEIPLESVNRYGTTPSKKQAVAQNQVAYAVMGYAVKDTALLKHMTGMLDVLNNATTTSPINGTTVQDLTPMIKFAVQSQDARKAPLPVWQVAGVLIQRGRGPESLNWAGGALASKSRHGSTKAKLQKIAESM
jgi:hypothetical protein